eukprot:8424755-Ditylum_brightwellii.AAC.1
MWETATHPRGTFIPARAWLITLPEMYKTLLRKHNVYLQSTTAIALEGTHAEVATTEIAVTSERVLIREYLTRKSTLIESMEQTNKTESDGKWLFIVRKHNVSAAVRFLNKELQDLFQKVVPNGLKFDGLPIPCHANNAASKAVGSYAAVIEIDTTTQTTENPTQSKTTGYVSHNDLEAKLTFLREELEASQQAAVAEIQQNLQQHLETALHSIVAVMQKELIIQINNTMTETITSTLNAALGGANQKGSSSPLNTAVGPGRVKQSSASSAREQ